MFIMPDPSLGFVGFAGVTPVHVPIGTQIQVCCVAGGAVAAIVGVGNVGTIGQFGQGGKYATGGGVANG